MSEMQEEMTKLSLATATLAKLQWPLVAL